LIRSANKALLVKDKEIKELNQRNKRTEKKANVHEEMHGKLQK
jgi:hypothetical protein